MRADEMSRMVGITTKNIRFYEQQGLISVARSANGYRDYTAQDAAALERIKLMRKLGVPVAEIRSMLSGALTVGDCMKRHLVCIARERDNLTQAETLCRAMQEERGMLASLDAEAYLARMQELEKEGASFMDVEKHDRNKRMTAPVICALVMVLLMGGYMWLMLWAFTQDMPPIILAVFIVLLPLVVIVGVCIALVQRLREIKKGEDETDAVGKY